MAKDATTDVPVKEEVAQDTTTTDSSPVETKVPEKEADSFKKGLTPETKPETESKPAEAEPEAKAEEEAETDDTDETKEQPQGKAEERKQQLNTEIRDLVSQRNQLKAEVEQANAEAYQPATEQELVDEGFTATDARVEAMRQEIAMDKYNSQVADAQLTIESESQRVLTDFPMFDPNSNAYREDVAMQAADMLASSLIRDPNTQQVIGSYVSPYKLYQTIATSNAASATEGQIKGQKATEQMLSRTDSSSNAAPKKDSEGDLFKKGLLGEAEN